MRGCFHRRCFRTDLETHSPQTSSLFGKARDITRPYTVGPEITIKRQFYTDQFVLAAAKGDTKKVLYYLDSQLKQDVNGLSSTMKYSALHAASHFGWSDLVSMLVAHGAIVNSRNKLSGKTPLHYAAESRRFEVCRELLKSGASKKTRDMVGLKPVTYACELLQPESLEKSKLLKDAPGRILSIEFLNSSSNSISLNWSEPKNLGYDIDPIDYHKIQWMAVTERHVNPMHFNFLKVSERSERAFRKTSIIAMNPAKWLQT